MFSSFLFSGIEVKEAMNSSTAAKGPRYWRSALFTSANFDTGLSASLEVFGIVLPAIRSYGSKIGVSWSDLLLSNILVNLDGLTYDSEFFKPSCKVALNPVSRLSLLFGLL